jgi:hypothetical protein
VIFKDCSAQIMVTIAERFFYRSERRGMHAESAEGSSIGVHACIHKFAIGQSLTTNLINKKHPSLACTWIGDLLYPIRIKEVLIPIVQFA